MINIMKLLEILLWLMTMMMIFQATKVKSNFNKNFPKGRRKFVERGMKCQCVLERAATGQCQWYTATSMISSSLFSELLSWRIRFRHLHFGDYSSEWNFRGISSTSISQVICLPLSQWRAGWLTIPPSRMANWSYLGKNTDATGVQGYMATRVCSRMQSKLFRILK